MSQNWAEVLLFICVVAQFFCVTASVTSASRMMFAFSRDRAVPGHQLWRRVSRHRVPIWSVAGIGLFSAILMIPAVWNYLVGYAAGTAISVIGLYIAFILPVFLRLRLGDKWQEERAWSLGKWYKLVDSVAIFWVVLVTILFIFPLYKAGLPWESDFSWELTNYTVIWFAAIGLVFGGWWALSARKWFKGPVRMGTEEELERYEEEFERRTGTAPVAGS
jgi:amino acid transporter